VLTSVDSDKQFQVHQSLAFDIVVAVLLCGYE
jgi:hypothetical protein